MSRQKLAQELCEKDGKDWDELDDAGKHGYLHYADVVIRKDTRPAKGEVAEVKLGHTHEKPVEAEAPPAQPPEGDEPPAPDKPKPAPTKPDVIPEGMYWCTKCNTLHREISKTGKGIKMGLKHLKYKA